LPAISLLIYFPQQQVQAQALGFLAVPFFAPFFAISILPDFTYNIKSIAD
jgi:hypothetical protein